MTFFVIINKKGHYYRFLLAWKQSTGKIVILKTTLIKNNLKIYFFHIFIVFLYSNGQTPICKGLVAFKYYALGQKL